MAYISSLTLTLGGEPVTGTIYPSTNPAYENHGSVFLKIEYMSLQVWGTVGDIAVLGQTIINLAGQLQLAIEEERTERLPDPVEAFHANLAEESV